MNAQQTEEGERHIPETLGLQGLKDILYRTLTFTSTMQVVFPVKSRYR